MPRNSASGGLATTISDRATFERADDARSHRPDHAPEARLTAARSSGRSHCVVVAPAGYGKTTVLSEWDAADPRPFAWITLDDRHNDPALLVASIAHGLDRIEAIDAGIFDALSTPRPSISNVVVPRLVQSLGEREQPFVLVLDDVHALHDPEAFSPLIAMAQHLTPGSQLALAARSEPPMRFGAPAGTGPAGRAARARPGDDPF